MLGFQEVVRRMPGKVVGVLHLCVEPSCEMKANKRFSVRQATELRTLRIHSGFRNAYNEDMRIFDAWFNMV